MKVTRLDHTVSPEEVIERAYLACRNTLDEISSVLYDKETHERIERMFKDHHLGLLEHAYASFHVSGISRSCTHQLVRHRLASYAQLSMRSVEPDGLEKIIPPSIKKNHQALLDYENLFLVCKQMYKRLRELGIPKEDARFIIPMGIETQIIVTMNFRAWIHFLKLRSTDPALPEEKQKAQWEIRRMADALLTSLQHIAPNVFDEKYRKYWE